MIQKHWKIYNAELLSQKNRIINHTKKKIKVLSLNDLKTIRERGDFIQIYKLVHDIEKVNLCDKIKIPDGRIRIFQLSRDRTIGNEP